MSTLKATTILGAAISGKTADKARRTDSKENSAILRVAYLLAAADGDVSNDGTSNGATFEHRKNECESEVACNQKKRTYHEHRGCFTFIVNITAKDRCNSNC
jgi:hypothetical protein